MIFQPDDIQTWLRENLSVVGPNGTRGQVARLNNRMKMREGISAAWEVAVVRALMQLGEVRFEKPHEDGGSRPDIWFRFANSGAEFIADITAISDDGLRAGNQFTELNLILMRMKQKLGIGHLGTRLDVGGREVGTYGDSKTRLALPPNRDLEEFAHRTFLQFLIEVKKDPSLPHGHTVQENGIDVRISYHPDSARFGGGGYPSYTTATSIEKNPLFAALEMKRKQLAKSIFKGVRGIIVCDGGSSLLQAEGYQGPNAYSRKQIIERFLEKSKSVNFVLCIRVEAERRVLAPRKAECRLVVETYLGDCLRDLDKDYKKLEMITSVLPPPYEVPPQFLPRRIHGGPQKVLPVGGFKMSENRAAVPVRDVIGLLSGALDQELLTSEPVFTEDPMPFDRIPTKLTPLAETLKRMFDQGRTVEKVHVYRDADDGLDYLEFEFGDIDPRFGEYQPPHQTSEDSSGV